MLTHLNDAAMQLLDARARDRFAGENETIDPVAGHIPGARNRWFKENFDASGLRFKPPTSCAASSSRPDLTDRVVTNAARAFRRRPTSGDGTRGPRRSRLYGGSWSEWIADPSRPTTTGAQ